MGLRAWLTPVSGKKNYRQALRAIKANEYAYGVAYALRVEKDGTPFKIGDILIAWSGDTNYSLRACHLPSESKANTWFLDNYLEEVPDWHEGEGPIKYGSLLDEEGMLIPCDELE